MTIKELCSKQDRCNSCPFIKGCYLIRDTAPFEYVDDDDDKAVTKLIIEIAKFLQEIDKAGIRSIIETAKLLQED